nr:InlB B-repeat-containing protein [Lachnospiraceae bacterium]
EAKKLEEQKQAEEEELERQRIAAEEAKKLEDQKKAEEEQKRIEEEQKKYQEEQQKLLDEQKRKELEEQEKARLEALEREAKEAEEAAKKKAEEEAAKQAQQLAEQAKKDAEEAKRLAEEAKKKAEEEKARDKSNYAISVYRNGNNCNLIDFGTVAVGTGGSATVEVANNGFSEVDLIYGISNATSGNVFSLTCKGDPHLYAAGGQMSCNFTVGVNPSTPAGNYSARVYFADSTDPNCNRGAWIEIRVNVLAQESKVTSVNVTPSKANLAVGNTYEFYSDVRGIGEFSSNVTWGVANNTSPDTRITSDGKLTIANNESAGSLTVVAASAEDPTVKGFSSITLQRGSFNVSASADPSNGGTVSGYGAVKQGGSITLVAIPNRNYSFTGWSRDGKTVSTNTNYTITDVQENISVIASFRRNTVSVEAKSNDDKAGTVVGGGAIAYGGKTVLSAKANDGYIFLDWVENNQVISRDASIELNDLKNDRYIVAEFAKTQRNVSVCANPSDGGTVSGGGTYDVGKGFKVTAAPAAGYSFQGWTINNQTVSRDLTYSVDKIYDDYCLTANFIRTSIPTYLMSAGVATTGGTISPSGISVVAQGSNVTYTITPKSGFAVLAVAIDGINLGPMNSYTFNNIQGAHTIAAAFYQTNQGAAVAKESGQKVQNKKVQEIPKTEANTATTEATVDIKDAADGSAGDEFVEEMDLTDVVIPYEEPVVTPTVEIVSGPLQNLGITRDEAQTMVASGNTMDILDAAFVTGYLDAYAVNQLEPERDVPDYHQMSTEELMQLAYEDINPSFLNLDKVVATLLSQQDVMSIVDGSQSIFNISVSKNDNVDATTKKVMSSLANQKPLQYFDVSMMKVMNGTSERIDTLPEPMQVVIEVPNEIYKSGKTYDILHLHQGTLSVLPDLDNDPKTVTVSVPSLSSFAIAEELGTNRDLAVRFAVGALIALAVALFCLVILLVNQVKWAKNRKRSATGSVDKTKK